MPVVVDAVFDIQAAGPDGRGVLGVGTRSQQLIGIKTDGLGVAGGGAGRDAGRVDVERIGLGAGTERRGLDGAARIGGQGFTAGIDEVARDRDLVADVLMGAEHHVVALFAAIDVTILLAVAGRIRRGVGDRAGRCRRGEDGRGAGGLDRRRRAVEGLEVGATKRRFVGLQVRTGGIVIAQRAGMREAQRRHHAAAAPAGAAQQAA